MLHIINKAAETGEEMRLGVRVTVTKPPELVTMLCIHKYTHKRAKVMVTSFFYHIHQVAALNMKFLWAVHLRPLFWGRGRRRESAMVPFNRAMVFSYKLFTVIIALSLTIRPPFCCQID